ncbi:MAG: nucleotide exchange factor GrpE [Burkholderiales bacterium RIFCSPLOWO2_12_FULL_61_40]|nr:MAG: nucleotide exchange factor GrpE [Burkholderiales bacterium RIFCSPLOWO2_12_FULL_61_40]
MDAEAKERLIDEFRACLDDWEPGDADASAGEAGGPPVDLALLFSEMSVLRNEVRVEARQFKTALDEMRALTELLGEQNRRLARDLERAREAEGNAQRQTERRMLLEMLDVRDRIAAAMGVVDAYRPGWWSRLAPTQTRLAQGLREGIELTLRRLDEVLAERRVRAIDAVGGRLDPNTMRAVGVGFDAQRPQGEVLSEARRGYVRDDELLRLAEVIVNKQESKP